MGATLSLHRLFHTDDGYLRELQVPLEDQRTLSAAREEIRRTLRSAFRDWKTFVTKSELMDGGVAIGAAEPVLPSPKFRIQGSFAYHTVNDCQQTPPQQIDQDDGVFLPIGFVGNGGGVRPSIASKAYFDIVERALRPVCVRNGWTLNPGGPKDSCVRIEIGTRLHIDLPLYAVKDEVFDQLAEASARVLYRADAAADSALRDVEELSEAIYRALGDTEIALAHRNEGWIGSDPRKLEVWFENAVSAYGPIVRRLSRAFKGLRDAHWSECELGSICVMAAAVQALARLGPLEKDRDDLALLSVGREMVKVFAGSVENPAFPGDADKHLCKDWSGEFRAEVRRVFSEACDNLERAIFGTLHKGHAINLARAAFGDRVPDNESLIGLLGVAAVIREVPPAPQPRPMVPRTTSG